MDLSEKHYSLMDSRSYRGFPGFLTSVKVRGFTGRAASGRYSRRTLLLCYGAVEQLIAVLYPNYPHSDRSVRCLPMSVTWLASASRPRNRCLDQSPSPPHPPPPELAMVWTHHSIYKCEHNTKNSRNLI